MPVTVKASCSVDGCEDPERSRGWCEKHYCRWKRHGDPVTVLPRLIVPASERFWEKVDKAGPAGFHFETGADIGPCWLWTGSRWGKRREYGGFAPTKGASMQAHRFAFEDQVGPIPDGLQLDHLCLRKLCVRPSHLEPVTPAENSRRWALTVTHCPQSHPYDEANTIWRPDGHRDCRACGRAAQRRSKQRRRLVLSRSNP